MRSNNPLAFVNSNVGLVCDHLSHGGGRRDGMQCSTLSARAKALEEVRGRSFLDEHESPGDHGRDAAQAAGLGRSHAAFASAALRLWSAR